MEHKWSDVIKAWADGKTVQHKFIQKTDKENESLNIFTLEAIWVDIVGDNVPMWNSPFYEFRVKPEEKTLKYRVALMKKPNGKYYTVSSDFNEELYAKYGISLNNEYLVVVGDLLRPYYETTDDIFVKWLTDIIEVKIEEK